MTDTPVEEPVVDQAAPVVEEVAPEVEDKQIPDDCRWCGTHKDNPEVEDWLCDECGRYQDATICPTCGNLARVSLMSADAVPAAASPKKGKK